MRNATIQVIEGVENVADSDFLDKVKVLGWQVVTKRGEFKVGDMCIFVPIDTILPPCPDFEFLRNKDFRIKTCKLRKEISQGIVFPLKILANFGVCGFDVTDRSQLIDMDVTDIIGATHYEKPIPACNSGFSKGGFPTFLISRTDEERVQNIPRILEHLKGIECVSTIKCDGTSTTNIDFNGEYYLCSRNNLLKTDGNNVYVTISQKYDIMEKLKGKNIAIQGEICGPGIQGNKMELKEIDMFLFNVFDLNERKYYGFDEMVKFCNDYSFKMVPFDDRFILNHTMEQLLEKAKGFYPNTKKRREGIVIRPVEELSFYHVGRASFKVLNNEFLLEHGE